MTLRHLLAAAIFLAPVACGKPEPTLPQKPQILTDRNSIGFGQEYGSGTYIGTKPPESLLIMNKGLDNLHIDDVSLVGAKEITMDPIASNDIKGNDHTFIRFFFEPKAEGVFKATVTINSNADNEPHKAIEISGKGVKAPDAGP